MLKFNKDFMYREVILEHSKRPLNFKSEEGMTVFKTKNPLCGDEISLQIKLGKHGKIESIFHKSVGCSISVSSVSILTELLKGKTIKQAVFLAENFIKMASGETFDKTLNFEDAIVFENIKNYPARQACATIGWKLVLEALKVLKKEE